MPEVLGYVDPYTLTHGFVYAAIATPSQLMNPPFSATRHELYHLLGCGQHHDMNRCYEQISMLKQAAAHSGGFFPTFDNGSPILLTSRTQVNDRLNAATEPQYVVPAFAAGNVLNLWAAPHL